MNQRQRARQMKTAQLSYSRCEYGMPLEEWLRRDFASIPVYECSTDDEDDECARCHGDGMDPWVDYILPCPMCQGEQ